MRSLRLVVAHDWLATAPSGVFSERRHHPDAAEMYMCNLSVAYLVFSPVHANQAIFFKKIFFFVLGTNTWDYDVHIYGFLLNIMDLQGLPEVLICEKTAKTDM